MNRHPHELLSAYVDGELDPVATGRVAEHLSVCTECTRELMLIRTMGGAMRGMVENSAGQDVWDGVQRRLVRPVGWLLFVAGVAVWVTLMVVEWFRSRELTWEWMSLTAMGIGIALIAVGVLHEQYREWKETRYKDIDR